MTDDCLCLSQVSSERQRIYFILYQPWNSNYIERTLMEIDPIRRLEKKWNILESVPIIIFSLLTFMLDIVCEEVFVQREKG